MSGEPVRYRGRLFVYVRDAGNGWSIIEDDEREQLKVRTASLSYG